MVLALDEIDLNNIGSWPFHIKVVALVGTALALSLLIYWFAIKLTKQDLSDFIQYEKILKQEFENKYHKSVHLPAYKDQVKEMKKLFAQALEQMPEEIEVPGLLEAISQEGLMNGLEFKWISPLVEAENDFYAELPIQISVMGPYHGLAKFVSGIAQLERLITLEDFTITFDSQTKQAGSLRSELLLMQMQAKVYRYIEED